MFTIEIAKYQSKHMHGCDNDNTHNVKKQMNKPAMV